jgi:hypothetical protein
VIISRCTEVTSLSTVLCKRYASVWNKLQPFEKRISRFLQCISSMHNTHSIVGIAVHYLRASSVCKGVACLYETRSLKHMKRVSKRMLPFLSSLTSYYRMCLHQQKSTHLNGKCALKVKYAIWKNGKVKKEFNVSSVEWVHRMQMDCLHVLCHF